MGYSAECPAEVVDGLARCLGDRRVAKTFGDDGVRIKIDERREMGYLLDTVSGMPFGVDGGRLWLAVPFMLSPQHNVVDACYFRDRLRGKAPGQGGMVFTGLMTGGAIDRYVGAFGIDDLSFLGTPIVDYEAATVEQCHRILDEIKTKLSAGPYFRRLWLRGQRREYSIPRSKTVCDRLGFGGAGANLPSLLPSLGRYARDPKNTVDPGWVFMGPNHWWKKPFLVWIIRNNSHWLDHYPAFMARVEASLLDSDDDVFAKILADIRTDPHVPTEVDDLRQWFFAFFKFSQWIFVLQQYGYYASMLDVTWDLDTALFFTHSRLGSGGFESIPAEDGRLIYVFAESKAGASYFDSRDFAWGDEDWESGEPPRVRCQKAGAMVGSTLEAQNIYAHWVVARIRISGPRCVSTKRPEDLFPTEGVDLLLKTLRESRPIPEGLY